jgi:tetratricopeptide (TPR) repeat protein
MPQDHEMKRLLRAVIELYEHIAPSKWRALVQQVFDRHDIEGLQRLYGAGIQIGPSRFLEDYLEWKTMLGQLYLPGGVAFKREFWERLVEFSAKNPIQELEGYGVECCAMLLRETTATIIGAKLCQAEELNDAGYERHTTGSYEEAIQLHDEAISLEPGFSLAWVNKGIALKNLGRLDEAIACYDWVIDHIDARYKKAWHNKGVALKLRGELRVALECFDRAILIDPEYEFARQAREDCLGALRFEMPDGRIVAANIAHKFAGKPEAVGTFKMAVNLRKQGNYVAAARLFERVCVLLPDDADMLVHTGECYYDAGLHEEALERFHQAISLSPTNVDVWVDMARHYIDQQDYSAALDAATRATQYGDHPMAWANRSSALCALGRYTEGLESAQRALELDDYNPFAQYYLGACLLSLDRRTEGRKAWERLVQLHPESPLAAAASKVLDAWGRG